MEGFYSDNESEDEDDIDDSSKSKKKAAPKSGLFNFENKSTKSEKDEKQKREDFLSLLTKKTVEIEGSTELEDDSEILSASEEHQVERQIVLEHQLEYQTLTEIETDEPSIKALEAVDIFHDKIISENLDSSEALAETLAEIADVEQPQEESISLRIGSDKIPVELTEVPVALRVSAIEFVKPAKDEVANDKPGASIMQPIFDRVRSLDMPFKRQESKELEDGGSVSEIVDRLATKRQESNESDKTINVIKKKIELQVERIETEIKTKELTVKQAAIEKNKTQFETVDDESIRSIAPEANRLHLTVAPEKIGKVLVKAEANRSTSQFEIATLQPIDKRIETISRADLLELSAKTLVDGSTLRQVYETNLITERGLRRILIEHLRGGDIKRALRRELVEHEKDFERDPNMRDRSHQTHAAGKVINKLIMKADPEIIEQPNQLQTILRTQINLSSKNLSKKKVKVSWLDIVLLIFIGVLLTMVLTLVMGRQ